MIAIPVREQRGKDTFTAPCSGQEEKGNWKGKLQMMLFSDDLGRLYLISVDTNKKQTWVPLPFSRPTKGIRQCNDGINTRDGAKSISVMSSKTQRVVQCVSPASETSAGEVQEYS
jgi:hypothetical protein